MRAAGPTSDVARVVSDYGTTEVFDAPREFRYSYWSGVTAQGFRATPPA